MPYIKNVESRDSEEGEARQGGLIPVHQTESWIVRTDSHSWKRSSALKYLYKPFFYPLLKWLITIKRNQKKSMKLY